MADTQHIVSYGAVAPAYANIFDDPKYVSQQVISTSADGTKIIFQSHGYSADAQGYFVADLLTGVVTHLSASSVTGFSPDSGKVLFSGDYTENYQQHILDLTTGLVSDIPSNLSGIVKNGLSPDGTKAIVGVSTSNWYGEIDVRNLQTAALQAVSNSNTGADADGFASDAKWSPDGTKVYFYSTASNLLGGDPFYPWNHYGEIYVRDLTTGTTAMVSTPASGLPFASAYSDFTLSPDGTKLLFTSDAWNLTAGDYNNARDVFIKDLTTGQVTLVSTASDGHQGNGDSFEAVFSPDGTKVAFLSSASNLVQGDTNGSTDAFVKDLTTGEIVRVSTTAEGDQAVWSTDSVSFTPDGASVILHEYLTYQDFGNEGYYVKSIYAPPNDAPALTGDKAVLDKGLPGHDYVVTAADLLQGFTDADGDTMSVINVSASHGTAALGADGSVTITPDSGYDGVITLNYTVTDRHGGDTAATLDLTLNHTQFVLSEAMPTGEVDLISTRVGQDAGADTDGAVDPVYSPDGSKVAFWSQASDLIDGTPQPGDIFIRDLKTGSVTHVATSINGGYANGASFGYFFSPDGNKLFFSSDASDLVTNDTNGSTDAFEKDLTTGVITRLSTGLFGEDLGGNYTYLDAVSPDGKWVILENDGNVLQPVNGPYQSNLYIKNIDTGWIQLLSESQYAYANQSSFEGSFSADGTKVVFTSYATNLAPGDTGYWADIFVKDLHTGATTRVSTDASGNQADNESYYPVFSPDGEKVAFVSYADNLAGGANPYGAFFIKDLATGAIERVADGVEDQYGIPGGIQFSLDGSKIMFASFAPDLVDGDTNDTADIFVKDLITGVVTRISTTASGGQADGESILNGFVLNGQWMGFTSSATNLGQDGSVGQNDAFVKQAFITTSIAGVVTGGINHDASGLLLFDDVSTDETHTVSVDAPADALGQLTATVSHDTTGNGSGGRISWNFTIDDAQLGTLHHGDTRTEVFTVHLDDGYSTVDAPVIIVLNGADAAPVSSGAHATLANGDPNHAYVVTEAQLLQGYSDPDGDTLSVTNLVTGSGTVTDNHDGTYTIMPATDFAGTMVLSYDIADGYGAQLAATQAVSFAINHVQTGTMLADYLTGSPGDDTIDGSGGDDTILGHGGTDSLLGGDGNDLLSDTGYHDTLLGGAGDDLFRDAGTAMIIDGGAGTDSLEIDLSAAGHDVAYNAIAAATAAGTTLFDGTTIRNVEQLSHLTTGDGNDTLTVSMQGNFNWFAGAGRDVLVADFSALTTGVDAERGSDADPNSFYIRTGDYNPLTGHYGAWASQIEAVSVTGSSGDDTIEGLSAGHDTLIGGAGNDILGGGGFLDGGVGNDTLGTNVGHTTMLGGAGNDHFYSADGGLDSIDGGSGTDELTLLRQSSLDINYDATAAASSAGLTLSDGTVIRNVEHLNQLFTGSGNDTLTITAANGPFYWDTGNAGDDVLIANYSRLTDAVVTTFNQSSLGGLYDIFEGDTIYRTMIGSVFDAHRLSITGGSGNDTLLGIAGDDTLNGGKGADHMSGGAGNDTYYVDNLLDVVSETKDDGSDAGGVDRVFSTVDYTLGAFIENLNLDGAGNISGIGNSLQNNIYGNGGDNFLSGMNGNDKIKGGAGNDTISGGKGNDILEGGAGADSFVFLSAVANGTDHITDFEHGVDRLVFNHADYDQHAAFTLGSQAVGSGAQFVWNAATSTLSYDHDGAGGDAAIAIAILTGATVTASDLHFS